MATVSEYKQFAKECLRWAAGAETEEYREAFLQMACDWTLAAMRAEGLLIPDQERAPVEPGENMLDL
jgi:hypothetical protein